MVTFVSLFLWLMTDVHTVQVAVDPDVASVEIVLDGQSIGVIDGPPWEIECDFGATLRPHELVAVARDANGFEIGRAVQFVNLPRPKAEVEVVFEMGPDGNPDALRAVTESGERLQPLAVFVTFDGLALIRRPGGRFVLPDYDPRIVHIVSAEAHFPGGVTARRDVTFGGTYGSRVVTELTAVAVESDRKELPPLDKLQGLFRVRGEPARLAAVERPGGRVFFVRDQAAWPALKRMGDLTDRRSRTVSHRLRRDLEYSGRPVLAGDIPPKRDRFHLVIANPTFSRGLMLFPIGQPLEIERSGFPWLATHVTSHEATPTAQRLSEAVAVAGVRAAGDGCPRAVVLALSGDPKDAGGYGAEAVRDYLRALHVPLIVWSVEPDATDSPWGPVEDISNLRKLAKASKRLLKALDRQSVVWVEGRHLPGAVELAPNTFGLRLVE